MAEYGFENLLWFLGVVEDRRDPQKLGRVRVRAFGLHSDSKQEIPTEDLPWAIPIIGSYNIDYKPPIEGSWVFGFFIDGRDAQHPILLGVMPGMPTSYLNPQDGFNSKSDFNPHPGDVYNPDIPRLSRGEDVMETYLLSRYVNRENFPGYDWEEPVTSYNAQYPYNKTHQTESGHVFEMDDTPGSERINIHHKTGTFTEIGPNGTKISKVVGDNYTIVEKNGKLLIHGTADIIIKGTANITIESDCNLTVDGTMNTTVHGDYNLNVAGEININSGNIFKLRSSGIRQEAFLDSINTYAKKEFVVQAQTNISIHANTGYLASYAKSDVFIENGGDYYHKTEGQTNIYSDGNIAMDGLRIDLNTDGATDLDVNKASLGRPTGAKNSLRTLLPEPPGIKFVNESILEVDEYPIYIDPQPVNMDTHTKDIGD